MRHSFKIALFALFALATNAAMGHESRVLVAGLGLTTQAGTAAAPADLAFGGEATQVWQMTGRSEYSLFGGMRDAPNVGLRAAESYGGIVYSLPGGWGSSLEAGYAGESAFATRRYSLTGQLHASFSEGRALSVGLKYRVLDTDSGMRYGATGEMPVTNGYTLTPSRQAGAGFAPSFQVQMSYQHSAASTFGLALGREVETFTPFLNLGASDQRQFMFTGQHWFTPSWALSYDLQPQDIASPLRLQGLLRLGVRYRF